MNSISTEGGDRDGSVSNGDGDSSLEVAAAGAVTAITLGVAFGLLALGQPYFWIAFPIGFGAGMPLAVGLARWYRSSAATDRSARQDHAGTDAALTRYQHCQGGPSDLTARYRLTECDGGGFDAFYRRSRASASGLAPGAVHTGCLVYSSLYFAPPL